MTYIKKINNTNTCFLYLHGFLSSPNSLKAKELQTFCDAANINSHALNIPQLPVEPDQAIELCQKLINELKEKYSTLVLIGSSLGGYYATYLSEAFNKSLEKNQVIYTVLINPAVKPYRLLHQHVGIQTHYHNGQAVEIKAEHIEQLKTLDCSSLAYPQRYLVMLQTGDETLDYTQAADFYQDCECLIEVGGSHSFENFADKIPLIMRFAQVDVSPKST